jgi:nitroreductase
MGWQAIALMDTFLAIASRREVREYEPRPLPPEVEERILDAGRLSGSAKNRQPWRFDVVSGELLGDHVYEPDNLRASPFVVAIVVFGKGPTSFDAGRAAQNMLLAAWNEGVGGSPNGIAEEEPVRRALGLGEDERVAIILSFGYPARPRDPSSRPAEAWSARANRKPLEELVRRLESHG